MREINDQDFVPLCNGDGCTGLMLSLQMETPLTIVVDGDRFSCQRPTNHLLMVYKAARGPRHWLVEIVEATLEIPSDAFYTFSPGADGYCEIKGKPQGTVAPDDRDPGVTPRERQFVTPPLGSGISGGWHEPDASEAWQYVASE